jgi:hypothetical protein
MILFYSDKGIMTEPAKMSQHSKIRSFRILLGDHQGNGVQEKAIFASLVKQAGAG